MTVGVLEHSDALNSDVAPVALYDSTNWDWYFPQNGPPQLYVCPEAADTSMTAPEAAEYASAKFAAFREFERGRTQIEELREQAKPDNGDARAGESLLNKSSDWESKGAAVGAAAGSRDEAAE